MDMYKLKFTRLQNEIFRLLCIKAGGQLNQRGIAKLLEVSPTAIAKAIKGLGDLVKIEKSETMNLNLIQLNRDNPKAIALKRAENLKQIYDSGLVDYLGEKFPGSAIVLFGSYSLGEDVVGSDVDIAIIGSKKKEINLNKFEKKLITEIMINFYGDLHQINKELRENIINGITLQGRIELWDY